MKTFTFCMSLICVAFSVTSCKDEYTICDLPIDVKFSTGFFQYTSVGRDAVATAPNFTISVLNGTSPIINNQPNATRFDILLNPTIDTGRYVIMLSNNTQADTLTVFYTTTSSTISPECGVAFFHNISRIISTYNTIDSVAIANPNLTNSPVMHAKIYF